MIVSLLNRNSISSITLPDKVRGKFSIPIAKNIAIDIEGIDENWVLKSNKKVKILKSNNQFTDECNLEDMGIYRLQIKGLNDKNFIFAESSSDDRVELKKYLVSGDIVLNIGRSGDNQIVIANDYVSATHAQLVYKNGKWIISDKNSSNGTYVNGKRVNQCELNIGDVIYIMGVLIVVGNKLIAINNPDSKVKVNTLRLIEFIPQPAEVLEEVDFDDIEEELFYRSPRFKRDIETHTFKIDSPPNSQVGDEMPIMMAIGPSLTMGMASMATAVYGIQQGNIMSAITSGCMLLGTVLWPIISKKYESKRKKKKEALRVEKYKEYLERIKQSFLEETEKQREIILENNVNNDECERRVLNVSRNLWERSLGQNDFTNLDGASINRSLISIQSELKRRQAIFAETSKKSGISNIDIYKYQKMYRDGTVDEPLQHLFIISDEFAELKTQQPEFMTQLVSAARIGRSLGVHLILATQKPSGVVDDQIWSNAKFKACLKVQDKADSMDMLKRPEAAELQDTGRFYLQVGYNELFKLGQSAWSGAPYYPSDKVETQEDNSIDVIDNVGRIVATAKMDKRNTVLKPKKQVDAITEYISDLAEQENIKIRPLWLDPIPSVIYVDALEEKYNWSKTEYINPIVGEYDDPMNQRQNVLTLPLTEQGNTVVYGMPGSGKTTFVTTMMYSLMKNYTPKELNLYILDFSSETLTSFSKAPHVGDVVLSHENEKVLNLIKLLLGQIQTRKKLFADFGGDIISYNKNSSNKVPSIVVVINNYAAFSELYEDYENEMLNLTREGTKYGIYFVMTATGTNAVRFRILQNIGQSYVLQLTDETDYSGILGKTGGLVPSKFKGRGLCKNDSIYEFQIASSFESENQFAEIRNFCSSLNEKYADQNARKIPVLPDKVDMEFIEPYVKSGSLKLPVGVETSSLEVNCYDFSKNIISFIQSESDDEHIDFASMLINVISEKAHINTVVFDPLNLLNHTDKVKSFSSKNDNVSGVDSLFEVILNRHNAIKDAEEQGTDIPKYDLCVYVFESLNALKEILDEQGNEKINLILEKCNDKMNIRFIIAESSKGVSSYNFEKWFKSNVSANDALWIGNGITDQYYLKINKTTPDMNEDISAEYGFAVNKGKAVKIKLINDGGVE